MLQPISYLLYELLSLLGRVRDVLGHCRSLNGTKTGVSLIEDLFKINQCRYGNAIYTYSVDTLQECVTKDIKGHRTS